MKNVAIIIPSTGKETLYDAIESCLKQTYKNIKIYVVCDGPQFIQKVSKIFIDILEKHSNPNCLRLMELPDNTGKDGQNGHRIYAAMSFLADAEYISYLDEDCFFDESHIENCVDTIIKEKLHWCYSLRKIVSETGNYICNDDCESLGKWNPVHDYNLCDTSTYFIQIEVARIFASNFIGGWGHDRRYYTALSHPLSNLQYNTTGKYTLNYRIGGNENSVKPEFFIYWNNVCKEKFKNNFPWRK